MSFGQDYRHYNVMLNLQCPACDHHAITIQDDDYTGQYGSSHICHDLPMRFVYQITKGKPAEFGQLYSLTSFREYRGDCLVHWAVPETAHVS